MKKYVHKRSINNPSEEYISLHDVRISQIKKNKRGIGFICEDPYTVVKEGIIYSVSKGSVHFEGVDFSDCECYVFYGKASSEGEMLVGVPITVSEINNFLKKKNSTIELNEEYVSYSGILFHGDLRPYQEGLGVDWKHVVIKIISNTIIEYSGIIDQERPEN